MNDNVLEMPFDGADQRQCYELIGCAGEVVANAFAAGVPTVTVKCGSRKDQGTGIEAFIPGLILPSNSVSLRTESAGDISGARPPSEFNPFKQTLWPLTTEDRKPPTVEQVLFPVLDRIPAYVQLASPGLFTLEVAPGASYFTVRNWAANLFGFILARGGFQQWYGLCQAVEAGKRRFFFMFSRVKELDSKIGERLTNNESCYHPTWMLGDLLRGTHKGERPTGGTIGDV